MFCRRCGTELQDNVCPACGYPASETPSPSASNPVAPATANDKKSVGLNILSFFIPLAGLILYLTQKDEKPIQAKSAGKSALGGFITGFVLTVILTVLLVALGMYGFSVLQDEAAGSYETPYITAQDGWLHAYGNRYADTIFQSHSMTVVFDGVEVQFPCTYAEFTQKTGYAAEDAADLTQPLNRKDILENIPARNAEGGKVYIHFYNDGDFPATLDACLVSGMTVDKWNTQSTLTLPQEVQLNDTYQVGALTEKYGEPNNVYTGETAYTYASWTASWTASPTDSRIQISSGDGQKITEIKFKIYPAK